MRLLGPLGIQVLLSTIQGTSASTFAVFSDTDCAVSKNTITGQNGYPDGVCTNIVDAVQESYGSFMFITLDDGCVPTIYQNDTDELTCSGAQYIGYISECYNTSWAYYSIDECTSSSSSTSTASSSSSSSTTSDGISGGVIAGIVIGSVCGFGLVAALCAYLFWFRPKLREREKAAAFAKAVEEVPDKGNDPLKESGGYLLAANRPAVNQHPSELHSPASMAEIDSGGVLAEAPGDKGGVELMSESNPVELPGDFEHRSTHSSNP